MYEAVRAAVQPYLLLLVLQGAVLVWMWRRRVAPRRVVVILMGLWAIMGVLSLPIVGRLMLRTLEHDYPPLVQQPEQVDAIVVLGGGLVPPDAYRTRAQVSESGYTRCMHALGLYEKYGCPLILCGGSTEDEETTISEAEVMADALTFQGVDREDMILETTSLSTRQNAQRVVETIRERGFKRVVLVTHSRHMRRADLCFRKLGVEAIPSPCAAASTRLWGPFDETWIPDSGGIGASNWTVKEWVALLYYRMRGWI